MDVKNLKLTDSYVKVDFSGAPNETDTIPECLRRHAETRPYREAVVFACTDESREAVTFKELYDKSYQIATSLIRLGVKRHEIVVTNLRNCPEWLFLTFGTMMAGAIPVSISATCKDGSDILAIMEKLEKCSMLVIDPGINGDNWIMFKKLIDEYDGDGSVKSEKMPYLRYLVCHDSIQDNINVKKIQELLLDQFLDEVELPIIGPNDVATLFHTSGSTGVPKVVAHTHTSLLAMVGLNVEDTIGSNEVLFNDRPFSWAGGFPMGLFIGETRVTLSGFCPQPKDRLMFLIDVIKREQCTTITTMPPFLHNLMKREEVMTEDWPVKTIVVVGQPINRSLSNCVGTIAKYFVCIYVGTEFGCVAANTVSDSDDFIEYACGTPKEGNEVKIVDDNGEIVPVNTRGEICVRKNGMFKEYYNDALKTNAVKTNDGWYKTDDMGWMSEDGVLYVDGRKFNMIISGGISVAPEILEAVIKSCPGVDSVVIVPVPEEIQNQVLCACVIKKPGCDVTEDQIRGFCEEMRNDKPRLFTVLPTYYMFIENFPETNTGKTSRPKLIAMALAMFYKQ